MLELLTQTKSLVKSCFEQASEARPIANPKGKKKNNNKNKRKSQPEVIISSPQDTPPDEWSKAEQLRFNNQDKYWKLQECIDEAVHDMKSRQLPVLNEMLDKFKIDIDKIINMMEGKHLELTSGALEIVHKAEKPFIACQQDLYWGQIDPQTGKKHGFGLSYGAKGSHLVASIHDQDVCKGFSQGYSEGGLDGHFQYVEHLHKDDICYILNKYKK